VLASRPQAEPQLSNFKLVDEKLPPLKDGILVKTLYLSVDPYMRGRMNEDSFYIEPFKLGEVLNGDGVGQVLDSTTDRFSKGDIVFGFFPWQELVMFQGDNLKELKKWDKSIDHPSYALSILGMPGMTAYFGLTEICKPLKGETVLVTAASGAVGSMVGQIAKILGCKVIGIAGSQEKIKKIKEYGFEEGLDYKKEGDNLKEAIKKAVPQGIDCFYDNVGGPVMDAVFENLNIYARVAFCGAISQYNGQNPQGPRHNWLMTTHSITARGFIVFRDFLHKYDEGIKQMSQWLKEGKIKLDETVVEGFEKAPDAFIDLFHGQNFGKQIVLVSKPEQIKSAD